MTRHRYQNRNGLSLLEILLSIAILGGSLVVIGSLVTTGYRSAMEARLRSEGNILCDTKMAEVMAGIIELSSVSGAKIEENEDWVYTLQVEPSDQLGLLFVRLTVQQTPDAADTPLSLSLVRFVPDPDYDPTADDELNSSSQ